MSAGRDPGEPIAQPHRKPGRDPDEPITPTPGHVCVKGQIRKNRSEAQGPIRTNRSEAQNVYITKGRDPDEPIAQPRHNRQDPDEPITSLEVGK